MRLYLHLSEYEGHTYLAVASESRVLLEGHHTVYDVELVYSRREASEWIERLNNEPGEISSDRIHHRNKSDYDLWKGWKI